MIVTPSNFQCKSHNSPGKHSLWLSCRPPQAPHPLSPSHDTRGPIQIVLPMTPFSILFPCSGPCLCCTFHTKCLMQCVCQNAFVIQFLGSPATIHQAIDLPNIRTIEALPHLSAPDGYSVLCSNCVIVWAALPPVPFPGRCLLCSSYIVNSLLSNLP